MYMYIYISLLLPKITLSWDIHCSEPTVWVRRWTSLYKFVNVWFSFSRYCPWHNAVFRACIRFNFRIVVILYFRLKLRVFLISVCFSTYSFIWGYILFVYCIRNTYLTLLAQFCIFGKFNPFVMIYNLRRTYFRGFFAILYSSSLSLKVRISMEEFIT